MGLASPRGLSHAPPPLIADFRFTSGFSAVALLEVASEQFAPPASAFQIGNFDCSREAKSVQLIIFMGPPVSISLLRYSWVLA